MVAQGAGNVPPVSGVGGHDGGNDQRIREPHRPIERIPAALPRAADAERLPGSPAGSIAAGTTGQLIFLDLRDRHGSPRSSSTPLIPGRPRHGIERPFGVRGDCYGAVLRCPAPRIRRPVPSSPPPSSRSSTSKVPFYIMTRTPPSMNRRLVPLPRYPARADAATAPPARLVQAIRGSTTPPSWRRRTCQVHARRRARLHRPSRSRAAYAAPGPQHRQLLMLPASIATSRSRDVGTRCW